MEVFAGLFLSVWLTAGDWASIEVRQSRGFKLGLMLWLAAVLFPLVGVAVFYSFKAAIIGAIGGTLLSGLAYWCKRQDKLGAKASRLYLML